MASAELSRRVEKVVGYLPLVDMDSQPRREFHEALLAADSFEDLPGKWQGRMVRMVSYLDATEALEAVGLRE